LQRGKFKLYGGYHWSFYTGPLIDFESEPSRFFKPEAVRFLQYSILDINDPVDVDMSSARSKKKARVGDVVAAAATVTGAAVEVAAVPSVPPVIVPPAISGGGGVGGPEMMSDWVPPTLSEYADNDFSKCFP
jgi:hypothetical protein